MILPIYPRWLLNEKNTTHHYNALLLSGQASQVAAAISNIPNTFKNLIELLKSKNLPLSSRMGIGVVMEELATTRVLYDNINPLITLLNDRDARMRADVCYYLELANNPIAIKALTPYLTDTDPSVREMATDALTHLQTLAL